uniref:Uncharacterized protein n=1 Tax=Anguilla anguilla TaxID=7936 RepID=A0A0E9Q416_ANGAN
MRPKGKAIKKKNLGHH